MMDHIHSDDGCTHCDTKLNKSIWTAAIDNDLDSIMQYVNKGKNPSSVDSAGYTALHHAARLGYIDMVKYLVSKGADVNANDCGATPLHRASYAGHVKCCEILLEAGAAIDAQDVSFDDKKTALHKALDMGHDALSVLLLKYSPDLTLVDKDGRSCAAILQDRPTPLPPLTPTDFTRYNVHSLLNPAPSPLPLPLPLRDNKFTPQTAYPAFEREALVLLGVSPSTYSCYNKGCSDGDGETTTCTNGAENESGTRFKDAEAGMRCQQCGLTSVAFHRLARDDVSILICDSCRVTARVTATDPFRHDVDGERIGVSEGETSLLSSITHTSPPLVDATATFSLFQIPRSKSFHHPDHCLDRLTFYGGETATTRRLDILVSASTGL